MPPSEIQRAWRLLERLADESQPDWKEAILEHARIVRDGALFLVALFPNPGRIDGEVLECGAILHDVGRSRAQRVVEHGVKSGEIIREQGFPEAVARIGETHIGVGITAEEAPGLGLPARDFVPATPEERIVCYIDNLLYYMPEENRHELRDTGAVVARFTKDLGSDYGARARRFMEEVEGEIGPEGFGRFRSFVKELNRSLTGI